MFYLDNNKIIKNLSYFGYFVINKIAEKSHQVNVEENVDTSQSEEMPNLSDHSSDWEGDGSFFDHQLHFT